MASISRNSIYLLSGSVVQKILAFVYFIFLARFLGPDSVGKYTFAISFAAIFSIFIDLGLNQFLIREAARDEEKARGYFYNIISVKLITSAIIYLLIVIAVKLLPYPEITRQLVYLAGLVIVLENLANTNYSVLRGWQNLKYEGLGLGIYQVIVLATGLVILFAHLPLPYLIIPLILASIFNFLNGMFFLRKKRSIKISLKLDKATIRGMIKVSLPFFWSGLFGTVFSYIDVVLLSRLANDQAVGFYSAAGKIPAGLRMFPIALVSALYPAACFYFINNKEELKRILEQIIFYIILFTVPLAVGLWVLAEPAILILFGDKFLSAVPALKILSWSMLFVFLDYVFFTVLNAIGQEKRNVFNRAVAMIVIIIFNLLLIPLLQQIGSSIAFVLSFILLVVLGWLGTQKVIFIPLRSLLSKFVQVLVISVVMGLIMVLLNSLFPWWVVAIIGVGIYALGVWIMGLINAADIQYLKNLTKFFKTNR
ncbi:MAG: flippase [Patescibacteria group bacterium]|nr:flippase [Patescibacteria group bacterium]MDD5121391.1 flippase [Patescibacteria group bacterium]MDD5221798.1 flippase [Patescibacteria group bacterium]MDD5395690.1 flippase [Patescibacteria group bacterium]